MAQGSGLISFEPFGSLLQSGTLTKQLSEVAPALNTARSAILENPTRNPSDGDPCYRQSLDFHNLPESFLDDYMDSRMSSELHRILTTGRRLQESVDRVVVIDSGASLLAGRTITEACIEPYFNELSRAQRGGRPKLYFAGQDFDNDAARGLLTLLTDGRSADRLEDRWAIVVVNRDQQSMTARVASCLFCRALSDFYGDERRAADFLVLVSGENVPPTVDTIEQMAGETLTLAGDSASPITAFSTVSLLVAACVGMDVVRLLEGASVMNDHFRTAPPGRNAVLDCAAVGNLFQRSVDAGTGILRVWSQALQSLGLWYDCMVTDSFEQIGCPSSMTKTRSGLRFTKRGSFSEKDRLLVTDVTVGRTRCDPWSLKSEEMAKLVGHVISEKSLPGLLSSQIRATTEQTAANIPLCRIHLPRINEYTVGQLLQMLMLATVVQDRLASDFEHRD